MNGDYRHSVSLNGDWEFVTDPDGRGEETDWFAPATAWPDRTRRIQVPMAWEELDDYREYTGTAWYRRTVDVNAMDLSDMDVLLRFEAVDHETTVWVNGERVGDNHGGYLPFEFDITDAMTPGENVLVARVTDPADLQDVPHGKQGDPWYTRVSGIWQSVRIDFRPPTRVHDSAVTPDLTTATATVDLDIHAGERDIDEIAYEVRALRDETVVTTAEGTASTTTEAVLSFEEPEYWSPENPALYDLEVVLSVDGDPVDRYRDYFGLRSFAARGDRFYLNGEPIVLRGVLEQGYYPETLYRPPGDGTFEHEVSAAADLGFNLIRKHIKPAHPKFLKVADREGMLVWEELANPGRYTEQSRAAMADQLDGLVTRDYNRPSVVIWGLYNEEWGIGHEEGEETLWTDEEKQRFLADMVRSLRDQDPTRVVCDNSGWAHVATDVNDFHRYFVSPDQAAAWEADLDHLTHHPEDNYATTDFETPDAPVVVSELGTWGLPDVDGLRDQYGGDPPWFSHGFLVEQLKRPAGVEDRFASTDLPNVFGGFDGLADAWQHREYRSVKHLIEQMRTRDEVSGYVLTELSDIEWEFNGILDYRREEKNFSDEFAAVNGAVSVVASPDSHVKWAGSTIDVTVTVVNDTNDTLEGTLNWSLDGPQREEDVGGSVALSAAANGATTIPDSMSIEVPETGAVTRDTLEVSFVSDDQSVTTTEPILTVDESALNPPDANIFAEGRFASQLAKANVTVTHELDSAVDVALTDHITSDVEDYAAAGGTVVHIPGDDGRMRSDGPFTYHVLPESESWIGAASFFYQDSPLFDGLCAGHRLGWELEELYPYAVATDLDPDADEIHAGYVEGWLANWGSPLVVRDHDRGKISALSLQIPLKYGVNPVATLVCNRLVRHLLS